jgi:hypothetical protein
MDIERILGVTGALVISSGQVIYVINCLRRKITPSVLSWFGWACLMGTSLVAQIVHQGWQWSMTGIASSTFGCLTIAGVAWLCGNYSFLRRDLWFLLAGFGCIAVYVVSDNPWVTTVFAIIADALLGVPTIVKAWRDPALERSPAWMLGSVAAMLAVVICRGHYLIYFLFPVYLFLFNSMMAVLTWGRRVPARVPMVVVAGLGLAMVWGGCHKGSGSGVVAGRTYRMGFATSAPRPDLNLILQTLGLWPQHADAAIISTEVPWDSLVGGEDVVKYAKDNYEYLIGVYRSKNFPVWIYIDPENGINRTSDSYKLLAFGKSIAQPAIQQIYRRFVVVMDSLFQPDHLGLALETNLVRAAAPDSIYQGVKAAVNGAAADVRVFSRQGQLLDQVKATGVFQLTYTDLALSGWGSVDSLGLAAFAFIGLVDTALQAKPALAAWDSLRAKPLRQ